ncbi:MAG: peptidylprolyl isomerase [bacterium]
MIHKTYFAAALTAAASLSCANPAAVFHTTAGDFTVELLPDKAPKTVENFISLAKGAKTWKHPGTNEAMKNKPLYNGTIFHRTISGFMIQGGDPTSTGRGNPGYKFEDEFSDLVFDKPGLLAMANSGPNTNGCQFFVTVAPTPHLNNKHTVFGLVTNGMDVVYKIANAPTSPGNKPVNTVTITSVEIKDDEVKPAAPQKPAGDTTGTK